MRGKFPLRNRADNMRARRSNLRVESLEGRSLMTGVGGLHQPYAAHIRFAPNGVVIFPEAVATIAGSFKGGPGSEFAPILRKIVPNYRGIVDRFITGDWTEYNVPGLVFQVPKFNGAYTGPRIDQLSGEAAGGLKLHDGSYEFAALMRGPINNPFPSTYVFGIDRGAGPNTSTPFPSRPNIKVDTLVTVTRTGSGVTGTLTDLTNKHVTKIDPSQIEISGPTLRVYLSANSLPSKGLPTNAYRFAFWTAADASGTFGSIGSVVPEYQMGKITTAKVNRSA